MDDFRLIEQEVEYWRDPQIWTERGILKKIERCGRVAWASEDMEGEGTEDRFFAMLLEKGHTSVLEHVSVCLTAISSGVVLDPADLREALDTVGSLPYFAVETIDANALAVCANLRAWVEASQRARASRPSSIGGMILADICHFFGLRFPGLGVSGPPGRFVEGVERVVSVEIMNSPQTTNLQRAKPSKRFRHFSFHIVTDRAVANEIVRHRTLSFTQLSTRYAAQQPRFVVQAEPAPNKAMYEAICRTGYNAYMGAVENGASRQNARAMLPLGLATRIVVSGYEPDMRWFVKLRSAKGAHPLIKRIADGIAEKID